MKLTPRLETIAKLLPKGKRVGDVGSDHGYLVAYLVEQQWVSRAIATDINQGPVDNAISTLKENNMLDLVEVRLGGGLEPYVDGEIDIAVIAGMGGMLIRDIILERLAFARNLNFLVLQPMTQQTELRKWLVSKDFEIFNEKNVREGNKYYEIFCIKPGKTMVIDPIQYEIGFKQPLPEMGTEDLQAYEAFLKHKINKYHKIIGEITHKGSAGSAERLELATEKLHKIEEVLNDVRQR